MEKRNAKLVKLLNGVAEMKLGDYQDNIIDAFGDAYEYLMDMYASNAGKSGGEYYTPQEVSELLTRITVLGKNNVNKVYDLVCGSGSLLLKFEKVLGKDNVRQGFFGQEINITTYNLCCINMFLHDIGYEKFNIGHGDTLIEPLHWDDEPFEALVSNPTYSIKWEGTTILSLSMTKDFLWQVCLRQSRRLILHLLYIHYHGLRQTVWLLSYVLRVSCIGAGQNRKFVNI